MQANTMVEPKLPEWADLRELAALEGPCVSIYLSGHKAGTGSRPVKVRLRAMLTQAESLLASHGVLPTDRESLLEPIRAQVDEADIGGGHGDGAAIFRTPRSLMQFRLAWDLEDQLAVEGRPLLTPLVRALETHRGFLLLALSKKNTRLLECGPSTQQSLDLPAGVPRGIDEYVGDEPPQQIQGQTGAGMTFSHDTYSEKQPRYLHDFCRTLERGMQPMLERRGVPLVLAGTSVELAAYRAVNRYALLAPEAIEGSPDGGLTDTELADKGRVTLQAWHPAQALHAVELYMRAGPGKKSSGIEEILRAAAAGRVLHLLLAGDLSQTGAVDRIIGRVQPSGSPLGLDDNLANAAAVETWRHGGHVWGVDEALDGAAVAAVFRW